VYLNYFGLEREPFHITPDPDFLFPSPSHKEAFASVLYGVQQQKGFVVVTGEVGTGKTTILRAYIQKLKGSDVQPIYIFDPHLSFDELLEAIMHECGNDATGLSQFARLQWLRHYLIDLYEQKKTLVLIIDEAQNMPVETLEQLRVLTNLETTKDKLLQVLLVGQPELEEKLGLHQLRQLNQRVAVRAKLKQLSKQESIDYIKHRLIQAGAAPEEVFSLPALQAIVKYAQGNPRTLNITCDNVLISAFGARQVPVQAPIVREVLKDIAPTKPKTDPKKYAPLAAAAGIAVLLALGGFGAMTLLNGDNESAAEASVNVAAQPAPAPAPAQESAAEPLPDTVEEPAMERELARIDRTIEPEPASVEDSAAAVPAVSESAAPEVTEPSSAEPIEQVARVAPIEPEPVESEPVESTKPVKPEDDVPTMATEAEEQQASPTEPEVVAEPEAPSAEPEETAAPDPEPDSEPATPATEPAVETEEAPEAQLAQSQPEETTPATEAEPREEPSPLRPAAEFTPGPVVLEVNQGDNLSSLLRAVYGTANNRLIEKVQQANPRIQDPNLIWAGEELVFPDTEARNPSPAEPAGNTSATSEGNAS